MTHQWFYESAPRVEIGPLTESELITAARNGLILSSTRIKSATRTDGQWVFANDVNAIRNALPIAKLHLPTLRPTILFAFN